MKFRVHEEEAMDRRSVRLGTRLWGSDEDLAGDVGVGMDPELQSLTEVCYFVHFFPLLLSPFLCRHCQCPVKQPLKIRYETFSGGTIHLVKLLVADVERMAYSAVTGHLGLHPQ